jgi:hypothetical protein
MYNPSEYQWVADGKAIVVSEMSEDQLKQALCESLAFMEDMDSFVCAMGGAFKEFFK